MAEAPAAVRFPWPRAVSFRELGTGPQSSEAAAGAAAGSEDAGVEAGVSPFEGDVTVADSPLRLSVMYQPLPLKTIAGDVNTRRARPPHLGQDWVEGASKPSRIS